MHFLRKRTSLILAGGLALTGLPPASAGHPVGHAPYLVFKSMDTDNDGQLTRAEYAAGSRQLFADMDTNRDGRITAAEMAAIYPASGVQPEGLTAAVIKRMVAETIQLSDQDNDGQLTAAELAAGDEAMFARLDQNKDGWLSQSECDSGKAVIKKDRSGPEAGSKTGGPAGR